MAALARAKNPAELAETQTVLPRDEPSSVRRRPRIRPPQPVDDFEAATLPSFKRRAQARAQKLQHVGLFLIGVLLGVSIIFASDFDAWLCESRTWMAHELRSMKAHPSEEDLALPHPHRMVARAPRKVRRSTPSVLGVPPLDVNDLPPAR
jgi:hypothetical protein